MADVIVIEPGRHESNYWRDLWRYRELFRVLAWRDLAVRYKQTVIGVAWMANGGVAGVRRLGLIWPAWAPPCGSPRSTLNTGIFAT
jgi:ABC-type polysaccharide/polyol phosphate export permease